MLNTNVQLKGKTILVTGAAGFIGAALSDRLCRENEATHIIGIDNMNDYYDVTLKEYHLSKLQENCNFTFIRGNIADKEFVEKVFTCYAPKVGNRSITTPSKPSARRLSRAPLGHL